MQLPESLNSGLIQCWVSHAESLVDVKRSLSSSSCRIRSWNVPSIAPKCYIIRMALQKSARGCQMFDRNLSPPQYPRRLLSKRHSNQSVFLPKYKAHANNKNALANCSSWPSTIAHVWSWKRGNRRRANRIMPAQTNRF